MRTRLLLLATLLVPVSAAAQSTGTVAPWLPQQFFDASGDPCDGCKLLTRESGTTTELDAYQDVTLDTPHANPIVLDSDGRPPAPIYLSNNSYRFTLSTSADVQLWDLDGVSAVPTASGNIDVTGTAGEALSAGDVVYLSDGSGSLTAGRWYKADADNTYSSSTAALVGMATAAISSGSSGTIRLSGRVTGLSGLTSGQSYYLSATAGATTVTPPGNSRFLGVADSTTTLVVQSAPSDLRVPGPCTGRLTPTSGTPITATDVSGATSLYWTPLFANECWLYDGLGAWTQFTFTELTISIASCTASTPYDVFVYNNSGTFAAEITAWTNTTTRATALTLQNGVYVKSGATTRRYVGTFYCNSSGGQTDDTVAKRFVWNYYNRVQRTMRRLETTASWTYTTATVRQARASTANQVEFVVGLAEINATMALAVIASNTDAATEVSAGIGLDSTTAYSGSAVGGVATVAAAGALVVLSTRLDFRPSIGLRTVTWLEWSEAAGTTTWYGANVTGGPAGTSSGLTGFVEG